MPAVFELKNLTKRFSVSRGIRGLLSAPQEVLAVDNVNLSLAPRKVLGLVGESGSGKSTCGLMAMRLLDASAGEIWVNGTDISGLEPAELKPFRREIQMVFQDSYSSLDPMMTLSEIIAEPYVIHGMYARAERLEKVGDLLEKVGLDRSYRGRYPHELSGGQRQRVSIARALSLEPRILVADEPTSALDVSVKAQVINLLHDLQEKMELSILFISHELNIIRSLADEIAVMYCGRIVEMAPTEDIFQNAQHPYTRSLLDAIPSLDPHVRRRRKMINAEDIAASIPVFCAGDVVVSSDAKSMQPSLLRIADHHLVEGRIRTP